jgi:hypothetical protein
MIRPTTRRGFLKTAAAGGGLLIPGSTAAAPAARNAQRPAQAAAPGSALRVEGLQKAIHAPILVVTESLSRDVDPRAPAWVYIQEIFHRAGLFFDQRAPSQLPALAGRGPAIVVLAGHLPLAPAQRQVLAQWVKAGAALVGIGGTSGLEEVFGVNGALPLAEGWLKVTAQNHPVTAGLRSSLHVFGGYVAQAASATSLAEVDSDNRQAKASAILENRFGKGRAILLAPDLVFSIVHLQ